MLRLVIRTAILLAANAVGLIVAAMILEGMRLDVAGFVIAVVVFTATVAISQPFLASVISRNDLAASALGGVALLATLVALIVTSVISDGLSIDGIGTWLAATFIVWVAALAAAVILPFLGLKKFLERERAGA